MSHGHIRHEFCSAAARELHLCEVDVGGATREIDIEGRVRAAIADIPTGDLVRVVLTGEYEPGLARDLDALSLRFKGSHFYIDFRDASRLRISSDDYKNDKSLKGEFIRLVMSKKGLTESEKAAVIECGLRAMAGEEI